MNTLFDNGCLWTDDSTRMRLIGCVTKLVSAYVRGNALPPGDLPNLFEAVYQSVSGLVVKGSGETAPVKPTAAAIRGSVRSDYIVSFLDGKPYKTLKRHLTSNQLTPAQYRARYGLPDDYPMVSSDYAAFRAEIARATGLGSRAA